MLTTLASLWVRASWAVSTFHASAARIPFHLVGRDLFAVARSPDDDAQASVVAHHAIGGVQAERRIVVLRVVLTRADVDDLVAVVGQGGQQELLELVAGVVGA
jgi:hypothetical protein